MGGRFGFRLVKCDIFQGVYAERATLHGVRDGSRRSSSAW
jgi:hypothetical protein